MRFMVIVKATKDSEAGVMPSQELLDRDGKIQRRAGEGRRDARGRRPAGQLEGCPRRIHRRQANRHRRPVRRNEGAHRRLLDVEMQVARRSDRLGQAMPESAPGRRYEIEIRQVFEVEDFGASFTPEAREQEEQLRAKLARTRNNSTFKTVQDALNQAHTTTPHSHKVNPMHTSEPQQ